jgi:hypothetical protein
VPKANNKSQTNNVESLWNLRKDRSKRLGANNGQPPNKALQQTAATGIALPGLAVTAVAAAAELERSAREEADDDSQ